MHSVKRCQNVNWVPVIAKMNHLLSDHLMQRLSTGGPRISGPRGDHWFNVLRLLPSDHPYPFLVFFFCLFAFLCFCAFMFLPLVLHLSRHAPSGSTYPFSWLQVLVLWWQIPRSFLWAPGSAANSNIFCKHFKLIMSNTDFIFSPLKFIPSPSV